MDPRYLARIEHAAVVVSRRTLIDLAAALDTTISDLVGPTPGLGPGNGHAGLRPVPTELHGQECLRLIEPGGVGRVAFELAGRLTVVPVNFIVHDGGIVFRTAATTAIGRYGDGTVAFEVDRIDEVTEEGWSVLISGIARQLDREQCTALGTTADVLPWAGGAREIHVLITPTRITGRAIRAR